MVWYNTSNRYDFLLKMIVNSSKSEISWYEEYYMIIVSKNEYRAYFCEYDEDKGYVDLLTQHLDVLKQEGVIWNYGNILFSDEIEAEEYRKRQEVINNQILLPFNCFSGPYYIECDKEKVQLFYDLIHEKRKRLCKIWTVNQLIELVDSIGITSFVDWMELDKNLMFTSTKILIYAIVSSNKENIAKMYDCLSKLISPSSWNNFIKWPLELEKEVVHKDTDSQNTTFNDSYWDFLFNSDCRVQEDQWPKIIKWTQVTYDYNKQQMNISGKYISFKSAKLQATLIEHLINSDSIVSSYETKKMGIVSMKTTIDDIKEKMKKAGISTVQCKWLFHYFTEDWVEYCRILL